MNVLFWNVNLGNTDCVNARGHNVATALWQIVQDQNVSVVIIAEGFRIWPVRLPVGWREVLPIIGKTRIRVFTELPIANIAPIGVSPNGWAFGVRIIGNTSEVLLIGVHLLSKTGKSSATQNEELRPEIDAIKDWVKTMCSSQAVVVGDFNLHPFDLPMINPMQFNAIDSRTLAVHQQRKWKNEVLPYFYNPTWALYGDYVTGTDESRAPGSYFWFPDDVECHHWNLLDQVLVSPNAIPLFRCETLKLLETAGGINLLDWQVGLDSSRYSDHLPLFCSLNL